MIWPKAEGFPSSSMLSRRTATGSLPRYAAISSIRDSEQKSTWGEQPVPHPQGGVGDPGLSHDGRAGGAHHHAASSGLSAPPSATPSPTQRTRSGQRTGRSLRRYTTPRVQHVCIETEAAVASYDPGTGETLVRCPVNSPFPIRKVVSETRRSIPDSCRR